MDLACERLLALGRPDGLIACTDADSEAAPDWLAAQLAAVEAGAEAIGGRAALSPGELAALPPQVRERRETDAATRLARAREDERGPHASTGSSPAPRWRSPPASTSASGRWSRAPGSRTRASSACCAPAASPSTGSRPCA